MTDRKFYIRRGNKAIGPLALERLQELLRQGSLQSDSIIGESSSGPWLPLEKILESYAPKVRESVPAPTPAAEFEQAPSPEKPAADGLGLDGIDFASMAPPATPPVYWQSQATAKPTSKIGIKPKQTETPWYLRILAPWLGENERSRYGNLERYIIVFRVVAIVSYIIGFVALCVYTILGVFFLVSNLIEINGSNTRLKASDLAFYNTRGLLTILLAIPAFLLGWVILHLFYIISMAFIDFLRLMIDLEGNTRKVAEYAESDASS